MGEYMTLGEATRKLKEMHMIEEKLLDLLADDTVQYQPDDLKTITTKIFEVVEIIMKLTVLIHEARKRGDNRL